MLNFFYLCKLTSKKAVNFCASELPLNTVLDDDTYGMMQVSGGHESPEHLPASCFQGCLEFIRACEDDLVFDKARQFSRPETNSS